MSSVKWMWRRNRAKLMVVGCFVFTIVVCMNNLSGIEEEQPDFESSHKLAKLTPRNKHKNNVQCYMTLNNITTDAAYPNCRAKIEWMIKGWETDACYAAVYGVDGTICSFYVYLSTVETHCKPLDGSMAPPSVDLELRQTQGTEHLFELMADNPTNFQWIKSRISRLFSSWKLAVRNLVDKNAELEKRKKMTIVLYLGFLSKETGLKFGEKSGTGGPLGELVQWADLITSIHLLGHNLSIATELKFFRDVTMKPYLTSNACPATPGSSLDLIFTDIIGLRKIKQKMRTFYVANKCRIRLLDSFGTHAEFNDLAYFKNNWPELGKKKVNPWGGHGLELQQFLTMYPHTDDNSFLGFVVETFEVESEEITREDVALIYGKEKYMWNGTADVIQTLKKFTKVEATVADADDGFVEFMRLNEVKNHGLLNGVEFHTLLRKCRVFVGLGFPLEGPAPLEAVANGAIFINHRFDPPKSRLTYKFFADKPTLRELTSQSPYMERFLGEPYVYTVDVFDPKELEKVMEKVMKTEISPHLPTEFSFEGMLERVDVILTRHDFCGMQPTWPPFAAARIIQGKGGESCQDTCEQNGLICERSFFRKINNQETLKNFTKCSDFASESVPYAPADCTLQSNPMLFSCASHVASDKRRLCPCRTFKKGQIVLCDQLC